VPVFIVVSTIVCIRTPIPRRKWLWIIFILVGFGQFELNWTTGDARLKLGIQLLGAAATWLGPYAPMILSVSLPVGAAVFWMRRKKWLRMTPVEPAQPPV
jgi:hypothetical protein